MKHLLLIALLATGCGESARVVQLDIAHGAAVVLNVATDELTAARSREVAAAEEAHPNDPEHDAAIDAVAERWEPVALAVDACRAALIEWIGALQQAASDSVVSQILSYASRLVHLYDQVRDLASRLDVELPPVPSALLVLLGPGTSLSTAKAAVEGIRDFVHTRLPEVSQWRS